MGEQDISCCGSTMFRFNNTTLESTGQWFSNFLFLGALHNLKNYCEPQKALVYMGYNSQYLLEIKTNI